jgi:uridine phosphorylase
MSDSSTLRQMPPILADKQPDEPSAFTPENLLREARRQKGLPTAAVPAVCVLDPDGDLVRDLVRSGRAVRDPMWACYHTELHVLEADGLRLGLVGGAVGASFAVLVAEELFATGCRLLLSITSAGQVTPIRQPPYFVLIERALRDEGTSYHYLPPARYSEADPDLVARADAALATAGLSVERGCSWTTDAPFRETSSAISARRAEGILAVEMEAAALYAFGAARGRAVLCFAHITNQMAQAGADFEKGPQDGATEALGLIEVVARALLGSPE